jgi:hypothetical protein
VAWRLVSGNNRELGRSAVYLWGSDACLEAIDSLTRALHRAQPRLSLSPDSGLWGWVLSLDGEPVAMSGRGYYREREARYSLDQFLVAAPAADVSPGVRPVVWGADAVGSLARTEGSR